MSKTVLVLAPHTDDGEFGCGGSIAHFVKTGYRVVYVAFSAAEQSVITELIWGYKNYLVRIFLQYCLNDIH